MIEEKSERIENINLFLYSYYIIYKIWLEWIIESYKKDRKVIEPTKVFFSHVFSPNWRDCILVGPGERYPVFSPLFPCHPNKHKHYFLSPLFFPFSISPMTLTNQTLFLPFSIFHFPNDPNQPNAIVSHSFLFL